jgi:nitroimidazol reductase NimA-like FMN-containing flavoprotein (pyridoxamine 5'-phosphate oxidase superfamily)
VPVFFTYREGRVYVQTSRDSVKVCNVLKNDNVAVAVYSGEDAVIIWGRGRIIDDEQEFIRKTHDHVDKYRLTVDRKGEILSAFLSSTRRYVALLRLHLGE